MRVLSSPCLIRPSAVVRTPKLIFTKTGIEWFWHFEDRCSCYIRIIEANKMHYFSTLFWYTTLHVPSQPHWQTVNVTYLPTPWCRVLLEKLTGLQLVKKFPEIHGTRRFITALTSVRHLSVSWANPIQSIYPHPTSWRSVLIISTHLRLRSPQWSLSLRFPHQDPVHPPLLTHTRHMPSPSHSSRFYHPHNIGWGVQVI